MPNTALLLEAIKKSGLKREWLATQLNLSRCGLLKKINGETEFKASEIIRFAEILSLTAEERDNIFLPQ